MLTSNKSDFVINYNCFEHCLEAVLLFAQDGDVIYCNEAGSRELGDLKETGNNYIQYVFPKVFEVEDNRLSLLSEDFIQGDENCTYYETFAYRSNQTCYPVRLKVVIYSNVQKCAGICYAIDISKEVQSTKRENAAKKELNKAINIKNEFLANITHELRTPVNGIQGLANNLLETNLTPLQLENVQIIIRSCDNMGKMVNNILDFSKITAGKLILERREFDFGEFIHHTLSLHSAAVNEKGLKLILNMGANIPNKVIGDELRLGQIINNLLTNAIKFTTIGQITLEIMSTYQMDGEIELFFFVVDSGIGISREEMDKLFVSFSQVDGSITRRFGGTGLGLVISKRLAELMGGSIHVTSVKGKGSTFSFSVRLGVEKGFSENRSLSNSSEYLVGEGERFLKMGHTEGGIPNSNANFLSYRKESEDSRIGRLSVASEILEKLALCIELGKWEKAENFAGAMKSLFLDTEQEERKLAFRLELAIRKENYDSTQVRIKEMLNLLSL